MRFVLPCFILLATACSSPAEDLPQVTDEPAPAVTEVSPVGLLEGVPADVSQSLAGANRPDATGALGRNRAGYFHVRFQIGVSDLGQHAARSGDTASAAYALSALAYAEAYQLPAGDYALVVPSSLSSQPPATAADLASGVSFFLGAAGTSLLALEAAPWFQLSEAASLRARRDARLAGLRRATDYLVAQRDALLAVDAQATNRLLHNAVAYWSMGRVLDHAAARAEGRAMLQTALAAQHQNGFFLENGGYDSSYNAVSLLKGLLLWAQLPAGDADRLRLWQALWRAAQWQRTRVLASGEISTQGNTRVYPGGESFLGEPKQVAAADCALAFWMIGRLAQRPDYTDAANRIRAHYN